MGRVLQATQKMIRESVSEILQDHVVLELGMYLNGYVPSLQTGAGFAYFLRNQLDCRVPSTFMIAPMSKQFVAGIEGFAQSESVEMVSFARGERKDDVARARLAQFRGEETIRGQGPRESQRLPDRKARR